VGYGSTRASAREAPREAENEERGGTPRPAGRRGVVRGFEVKDALAFRQVLGAYPTGVTIVATLDGEGAPCGMTVNAFTSVSLDPPLVLVCVAHGASSHDPLLGSRTFAVSVLAAEQAALAAHFSTEPADVRFLEVDWHPGPLGDPVVDGAAAWLACTLEAVHPGGDHSILVGRVEELGLGASDALVFYRGTYGRVTHA
jgi:flavin reductase (DIM6/NTAB) family NADH-FMN oxidoreductase RutF